MGLVRIIIKMTCNRLADHICTLSSPPSCTFSWILRQIWVVMSKVNWICAGATGSRDQARFNIEKANFGRTEKKEKGCTLFLISSEGLHPMGCYIDYIFWLAPLKQPWNSQIFWKKLLRLLTEEGVRSYHKKDNGETDDGRENIKGRQFLSQDKLDICQRSEFS